MKKIDLEIILENYDKRGVVFRGDHYKKEIFLLTETKKGECRGGHYHNKTVHHHILSGQIMYKEIALTKKGNHKKNYKEIKKIIHSGQVVYTPAYAAHLIIALEDTIIFETSDKNKKTITYQQYRDQIKILKK